MTTNSPKKQKVDKISFEKTTIDRSLNERLMNPLSSKPTSNSRENHRPTSRSSDQFYNEYWGRSRGDDLYRPSYSRERRMRSPERSLSRERKKEFYPKYRYERDSVYSPPRDRSYSPTRIRKYDPETHTITRHIPPRPRSPSPQKRHPEIPIPEPRETKAEKSKKADDRPTKRLYPRSKEASQKYSKTPDLTSHMSITQTQEKEKNSIESLFDPVGNKGISTISTDWSVDTDDEIPEIAQDSPVAQSLITEPYKQSVPTISREKSNFTIHQETPCQKKTPELTVATEINNPYKISEHDPQIKPSTITRENQKGNNSKDNTPTARIPPPLKTMGRQMAKRSAPFKNVPNKTNEPQEKRPVLAISKNYVPKTTHKNTTILTSSLTDIEKLVQDSKSLTWDENQPTKTKNIALPSIDPRLSTPLKINNSTYIGVRGKNITPLATANTSNTPRSINKNDTSTTLTAATSAATATSATTTAKKNPIDDAHHKKIPTSSTTESNIFAENTRIQIDTVHATHSISPTPPNSEGSHQYLQLAASPPVKKSKIKESSPSQKSIQQGPPIVLDQTIKEKSSTPNAQITSINLPHPWKAIKSSIGKVYYYNPETKKSMWKIPVEKNPGTETLTERKSELPQNSTKSPTNIVRQETTRDSVLPLNENNKPSNAPITTKEDIPNTQELQDGTTEKSKLTEVHDHEPMETYTVDLSQSAQSTPRQSLGLVVPVQKNETAEPESIAITTELQQPLKQSKPTNNEVIAEDLDTIEIEKMSSLQGHPQWNHSRSAEGYYNTPSTSSQSEFFETHRQQLPKVSWQGPDKHGRALVENEIHQQHLQSTSPPRNRVYVSPPSEDSAYSPRFSPREQLLQQPVPIVRTEYPRVDNRHSVSDIRHVHYSGVRPISRQEIQNDWCGYPQNIDGSFQPIASGLRNIPFDHIEDDPRHTMHANRMFGTRSINNVIHDPRVLNIRSSDPRLGIHMTPGIRPDMIGIMQDGYINNLYEGEMQHSGENRFTIVSPQRASFPVTEPQPMSYESRNAVDLEYPHYRRWSMEPSPVESPSWRDTPTMPASMAAAGFTQDSYYSQHDAYVTFHTGNEQNYSSENGWDEAESEEGRRQVYMMDEPDSRSVRERLGRRRSGYHNDHRYEKSPPRSSRRGYR
ncbi:hypothetical protein F4703DRAFT_1793233 [Phycomyces blakesleeanus]